MSINAAEIMLMRMNRESPEMAAFYRGRGRRLLTDENMALILAEPYWERRRETTMEMMERLRHGPSTGDPIRRRDRAWRLVHPGSTER